MLSKKRSSIRSDLHALGLIEHRDPSRHVIILESLRIYHHTHLRHCLIQRLALVCACSVHSDHQHSRLQRGLTVNSQFLQSLHHLGLLHNHQLTLSEHRISPRRSDHSIRRNIRTVAHCLIEILLTLIDAMLKNSIANHIYIIRLISHQKINRLEDAVLSILHNPPAQRISLYKTFCHNHTKIKTFLCFAKTPHHQSCPPSRHHPRLLPWRHPWRPTP